MKKNVYNSWKTENYYYNHCTKVRNNEECGGILKECERMSKKRIQMVLLKNTFLLSILKKNDKLIVRFESKINFFLTYRFK